MRIPFTFSRNTSKVVEIPDDTVRKQIQKCETIFHAISWFKRMPLTAENLYRLCRHAEDFAMISEDRYKAEILFCMPRFKIPEFQQEMFDPFSLLSPIPTGAKSVRDFIEDLETVVVPTLIEQTIRTLPEDKKPKDSQIPTEKFTLFRQKLVEFNLDYYRAFEAVGFNQETASELDDKISTAPWNNLLDDAKKRVERQTLSALYEEARSGSSKAVQMIRDMENRSPKSSKNKTKTISDEVRQMFKHSPYDEIPQTELDNVDMEI